MMWSIFWPDDVRFTNPANTRRPSEDFAADGDHLAHHIAEVLAAGGVSADPEGYGLTVASPTFCITWSLRPRSTASPAGMKEHRPTTRPKFMLSLVAGTAIPSGLKPSVAEKLRADKFPFVLPA